ncbi:MAG: heme ABC transporter permease [Wenzhouxiangellaceae bacterium]
MWKRFKAWFHQWGSPPWFYRRSARWLPWLWTIALITGLPALYLGLFVVPADYLQGDSYRIIFIHVPSAWMSMMIFVIMALLAVIALVWRIRTCEIMAMACAPIGAAFTAVTLLTGSLWGRPTWGTYWQWDGRMTSELVLLFLYAGVIALYQAIEDRRQAARAAGLLAIIGVINIPIIHYSVEWWTTLHQGSTIRLTGPSTIDSSMITPLLLMVIATKFYFAANLLTRSRAELLHQDARKRWVEEALT